MLGYHLKIIGVYPDDSIPTLESVWNFLNDFPSRINMHRVAPPYVGCDDKGNIYSLVIIAESHITVHVFPSTAVLVVDIFSCKDFDTHKALDFTTSYFNLRNVESQVFERGSHVSMNWEKERGKSK